MRNETEMKCQDKTKSKPALTAHNNPPMQINTAHCKSSQDSAEVHPSSSPNPGYTLSETTEEDFRSDRSSSWKSFWTSGPDIHWCNEKRWCTGAGFTNTHTVTLHTLRMHVNSFFSRNMTVWVCNKPKNFFSMRFDNTSTKLLSQERYKWVQACQVQQPWSSMVI